MNEHVGVQARSPLSAADTPVELESATAARMAEAATTFLAALRPDQRARTVFAVEDDERQDWHYIPSERHGLPFKEMDGSQQKLAHALLSSGLSAGAATPRPSPSWPWSSVLAQLEGTVRRFPRDPDLYHVTVFGTPSETATLGAGASRATTSRSTCSCRRGAAHRPHALLLRRQPGPRPGGRPPPACRSARPRRRGGPRPARPAHLERRPRGRAALIDARPRRTSSAAPSTASARTPQRAPRRRHDPPGATT